jgi:hypothetical protein
MMVVNREDVMSGKKEVLKKKNRIRQTEYRIIASRRYAARAT